MTLNDPTLENREHSKYLIKLELAADWTHGSY